VEPLSLKLLLWVGDDNDNNGRFKGTTSPNYGVVIVSVIVDINKSWRTIKHLDFHTSIEGNQI
jgi:hypothetical protein